jgi:hypothetical protein
MTHRAKLRFLAGIRINTKLLALILLFAFSSANKSFEPRGLKNPAYEYNLVVGSMFKDEAPFLTEWIEYHRILGVEHFYLYNNDSSDNYYEILEPYINAGIVELIDWSSSYAPWHPTKYVHWSGFQLSAFNDCIQRNLGKAKWVAILDIDEYILATKGVNSLVKLLEYHSQKKVGSIQMKWRCYGFDEVWEIPHNSVMIESLNRRAKDNFDANYHTKSIHRPEAVAYCQVHHADLKKGFQTLTLCPTDFRINHYCRRGMKHSLSYRFGQNFETIDTLTAEAKDWLEQENRILNQHYDDLIHSYVPALRKAFGLD